MRATPLDRLRVAVLVTFFILQVLGVVRARFVDDRFFAWAPLHEVTELRIHVVEGDRVLDVETIRARYAMPRSLVAANGTIFRELNDVDPLLARIARIECARASPGQVRLDLLRNGEARTRVVRCR